MGQHDTYMQTRRKRSRVLVAITDGGAFPLLEFALFGADEIDLHLDMLADEAFAQEFSCLMSPISLLRIRHPAIER